MAFLVATVDKIQASRSFLSTSGGARAGFGGYGRQNSGIYHDFCLLRGLRKPISEAAATALHFTKKQPKQSTAFKIGSSNPCIKEKGARSEVIQINNHG